MQSMRTTFCFALLAAATLLHAAELRVDRAILPGGVIDDRRLLSEINLKSIELRDAKQEVYQQHYTHYFPIRKQEIF